MIAGPGKKRRLSQRFGAGVAQGIGAGPMKVGAPVKFGVAGGRKQTMPNGSVVKKPPAGYYDPALDAAERASHRGLGDLTIDTDTADQRASTDYVTGTGRINEDAGLATTELGRRMAALGQSQAGAAVGQGLLEGGTFAASLAKRRENQGLAQAEIDRNKSRMLEDTGRDYQYGVDDRALGLSRAQREDTLFGQDTAAQRSFQARQAGYVEPKKAAGKKKPGGKKGGKKSLRLRFQTHTKPVDWRAG